MSSDAADAPARKSRGGCIVLLLGAIGVALLQFGFEFVIKPWSLWPVWPQSPLGDWHARFKDPYGIAHSIRLHNMFEPTMMNNNAGQTYGLVGTAIVCSGKQPPKTGRLWGNGWGLGGSANFSIAPLIIGLAGNRARAFNCDVSRNEMLCKAQFEDPVDEQFERTFKKMQEQARREVERQESGAGPKSTWESMKDAAPFMGFGKRQPYRFQPTTIIFKRVETHIEGTC